MPALPTTIKRENGVSSNCLHCCSFNWEMSKRSISGRGVITPRIGRSAKVSTLCIISFSLSSKWLSSPFTAPALANTASRMPIMPNTDSAVRARQVRAENAFFLRFLLETWLNTSIKMEKPIAAYK